MDMAQFARNLRRNDRGVWSPDSQSAISSPAHGNSVYFDVEGKSFWFQHRNRCLLELLQQFPPQGTIFDVGGGNGFVSLGLHQNGHSVVLVEPGPEGAMNAQHRGIQNVVCSTLQDAGFVPACMDAAGLFDVVEHIQDEVGFLRDVFAGLRAGGRLYLTVPAYSSLWSQEDVDAGHYRRYTKPQLSAALGRAGFEIEYQTYLFQFLILPLLLLRGLPYRLGLAQSGCDAEQVNQSHQLPGGAAGRFLQAWLDREIAVIRSGGAVSSGTSILAVARKPR